MIKHIILPIGRKLSDLQEQEEKMLYGDKSNPQHPHNAMKAASDEITIELNAALNDGYEIKDSFEWSSTIAYYRYIILHKPDSIPNKQASAGTLEFVSAITKMETFSKSKGERFEYWKFSMVGGKSVNVFNHPDAKRNTFAICIAAGWQHEFEALALDENYAIRNPFPITVSYDGEWHKLESILPYEMYTHIYSFEAFDDDELDVSEDD